MANKDQRELALAFAFPDAPAEVKTAAELHKTAYQRLVKSEAQLKLWTTEKDDARKDYAHTSKQFDKALASWDPAGIKEPKLQDGPKK